MDTQQPDNNHANQSMRDDAERVRGTLAGGDESLRAGVRALLEDVPAGSLERTDAVVHAYALQCLPKVHTRTRRQLLWKIGGSLAAATALGLVVVVGWPSGQQPAPQGVFSSGAASEDGAHAAGIGIDELDVRARAQGAGEDGRVFDIVDVYQMALSVKAGQAADAAYDRTGDGRVLEEDLRILLQEVVRVEGV